MINVKEILAIFNFSGIVLLYCINTIMLLPVTVPVYIWGIGSDWLLG